MQQYVPDGLPYKFLITNLTILRAFTCRQLFPFTVYVRCCGNRFLRVGTQIVHTYFTEPICFETIHKPMTMRTVILFNIGVDV